MPTMNRNDYRNWTADEIRTDAEKTWKRSKLNGMLLSNLVDKDTGEPVQMQWMRYDMACARLGLKLVQSDITYSLDAEGNPILDDKGNPVVEEVSEPAYDLKINVKVENHVDCEGTPIPKGPQTFVVTKQANNRQISQTHAEEMAKRTDNYVFTLEALIKDENGNGQNEQHRCAGVCIAVLTGREGFPPGGIPVITLDGCSVGAAGAIDTGKQKTATDDLSSDHSILAPYYPLRIQDYASGTTEGYGKDAKQMRLRILRETQGAAKRIALRMSGTNIKGSKFSGYASSGNVTALVTNWEGFDGMVNMVFAYVNSIPQKLDKAQNRPVKVWEVVTAYACYLLRDSAPLESIDNLGDYEFPRIDLDPLQAFLIDLTDSCGASPQGPLVEWSKKRVSPAKLKDTDESSFAQVCLALQSHLEGETPNPDDLVGATTSKANQNGSKFFHFGGGDRGPIVKVKKQA